MKTNTYVNFHGNCTQAFQYYEKHLGAKIGTTRPESTIASTLRISTQCQRIGVPLVDTKTFFNILFSEIARGDS
jgi:hypothetical protein